MSKVQVHADSSVRLQMSKNKEKKKQQRQQQQCNSLKQQTDIWELLHFNGAIYSHHTHTHTFYCIYAMRHAICSALAFLCLGFFLQNISKNFFSK